MTQQIFFFTGENAFSLREEKRGWKKNFAEKHGEENMLTLQGNAVTYRQLLDETGIMPFIAQKRLVIVEGTPRFTKEEVETLPTLMHPDCILLIVDPAPDKRTAGAKAFLKTATVKEFPPLQGKALRDWVASFAKANGSAIDAAALDRLFRTVGEDQDTLSQEIRKMCLFAGGKPIDAPLVDLLAVPSGEQEVWHLTSLLSQGNTAAALAYARSLLSRGEDPFSLWAILLWMLRGLVSVSAAAAEGERNPAAIASSLSVPFPTARTLLPLAGKIPPSSLRPFLNWALDADIDLKTGGFKATGEAPEELLALIDQFVVRLGRLTEKTPA